MLRERVAEFDERSRERDEDIDVSRLRERFAELDERFAFDERFDVADRELERDEFDRVAEREELEREELDLDAEREELEREELDLDADRDGLERDELERDADFDCDDELLLSWLTFSWPSAAAEPCTGGAVIKRPSAAAKIVVDIECFMGVLLVLLGLTVVIRPSADPGYRVAS